MAKAIITCGKICSGKSFYSNKIKNELNAVIISPDEATYDLINNEQGKFYDIFSERLNNYLTKKVGEIVQAGANVIYERGLWSKKERKKIREFYENMGIQYEIHYIYVDNETWKKNIDERNKRITDGNGGSNFYLNNGLMKKLELLWEEPDSSEVDFIYKNTR